MKYIFFLIVILTKSFAFSQSQKIDSLTIEFQKAEHDTLKARIIAEIGIQAYYIDFNKAKFYNDSLIQFSKGKSQKYEALGYRMQGTLFLIEGDYQKSENSYTKSLKIFKEINDTLHQGALIANLATLYARQNNLEKADSLYLEAINLLKNIKNDKQSINCFVNLGINANKQNRLELATYYFTETLREADDIKDDNYKLYAYNLLSAVFLKRNLLKEAENNLKEAYRIGKNLEDYSGLSYTNNLYGILYDELGNHNKALEYFMESKELAKKVNSKDEISRALINIGRQYRFLSNYDKAVNNTEKSIVISKSLKDSSHVATGYFNLAIIHLDNNAINKANSSVNNAKLFMPQKPDTDYHELYKELATKYNELNYHKEAFRYLKKYTEISDSLYIQNDLNRLADITKRYELEKKNKEIAENKANLLSNEIELKQKQLYIIISIVTVLILLLIISSIYYKKYKKKYEREKLKQAFEQGFEEYLKNEYNLKDEELDLWLKIVEGHTEKELAEIFIKSLNTIKTRRKALYKKLKGEAEIFKQKNAIELYYKAKTLYTKHKNTNPKG